MARKPLVYNARVIRRIDVADGLAIFRVRPDEPYIETFTPGQYIVLGMNHGEKGPVSRAYSIASPPHLLPEMDFYIRFVKDPATDNPLTHLSFTLNEGDRLFMGPKVRGHFTVEHEVGEADERLRLCVAAGTGLAPFTSMVFEHFHTKGPTDQYLVLHGASYPHDLGYREEMVALLNRSRPAPRYFPTVSRDPGNEPWNGLRGRVETLLQAGRLEELERQAGLAPGHLAPQHAVVFCCGLQGTISGTLVNLLDRGFVPRELKLRNALWIPHDTPASFFFEQYDAEPILDLHDEAMLEGLRERLRHAGVRLEKPADEPKAIPRAV